MKRTIELIVTGVTIAALSAACSKEDPARVGDNAPVFDVNSAYITVVIRDTGTSTRASVPTDGFDYGTDEQTVGTAHFYFYDHLGEFVTQASAWDGGTSSDTSGEDPAGHENIELRGNTVIALENLSGKTYPMYLVTVLNQPLAFTPGKNLDEMRVRLSSPDTPNGGIRDARGRFVMSTTSFAGQTASDGNPLSYCVTEVGAENFSAEPVNMEEVNPVIVHVERLAAKVRLSMAEGLSNERTVGGRKMYEIHATVAGDPNGDETSGETSAYETLYVEPLGWKLNATAKYSYILKNIDEKWTNDDESLGTGWTWNDPANFRSYWAKSYNYGKGSYPASSDGATDGTMINPYLSYFSLDKDVNSLGDSDYCAENTNIPGSGDQTLISSPHSSALTSVLLKARLCDAEGNPRGDLVRYENILWEKSHYLDYVLNYLTDTGSVNAYYDTGTADEATSEKVYAQIDASCVTLEAGPDGTVNVVLNDAAQGMTFYTRNSEGAITSETADHAEITAALDEFNGTSEAVGYKDGLMYYDIPVEHLNNRRLDTDNGGTPLIREANYGVVRNHSYRITVTKIESVGKGIYRPEEVIVPTEDMESYYVGAKINVLSWKIISQEVEL